MRRIFGHNRIQLSNVGERGLVLCKPFTVGLLARELRLDIVIENDFTLLCVDHDHLTGCEPAFLQDLVVRQVAGADLGTEGKNAVGGDLVTRGTKAVPVKRGCHGVTIGEGKGSRSVPRLAETAVVAVEIFDFLCSERVNLPRRRHKHSHGVGHGAT